MTPEDSQSALQAWWNRRFALLTAGVVVLAVAGVIGLVAVFVVLHGGLYRAGVNAQALEQRLEAVETELGEESGPRPAAEGPPVSPITRPAPAEPVPAKSPSTAPAEQPDGGTVEPVTSPPAEQHPPAASTQPNSRQWLERHVAEHPEHLAGQLLLAQIEIGHGQLDRALSRLEEATVQHPDSPAAWDILGVARFRNGQNRQAQEAFEQAIELDPEHAEAIKHLGILRWNQRQPGQAIELLERATALNSADGEAQYALAVCRALLGQRAQAIEALRSAVRQDGSWLEKARSEPVFVELLAELDWAEVQS